MHSSKMLSPPTSPPSSSSATTTATNPRLARADQKRRIHRARATNLRIKIRARGAAKLTAAHLAATTASTTTAAASTPLSPPPSPPSSTATPSTAAPSIFSPPPAGRADPFSSPPPPPTPHTDHDLLAFRAALARNDGVLADLAGYVRVYGTAFARRAAVTTRRAQLLDVRRRLDVCFAHGVRRGDRPRGLDPVEDVGLASVADAQCRRWDEVVAAVERELRATLDRGYRNFEGDFGLLVERDGGVRMSASKYREP